MGVIVPQLIFEPSGVQVSNVYLGFGRQAIQISKTFRDTNLEAVPPDYKKYRVSGYMFVKPDQLQFDSELKYFVEAYTDDITNPYDILYQEIKKNIPSTVDC